MEIKIKGKQLQCRNQVDIKVIGYFDLDFRGWKKPLQKNDCDREIMRPSIYSPIFVYFGLLLMCYCGKRQESVEHQTPNLYLYIIML